MRVVSPDAGRLAQVLTADGLEIQRTAPDTLTTTTVPAARIGEAAASHGIILHELVTQHASLEEAYLELTGGEVEYVTDAPAAAGPTGTRPSHHSAGRR